MPEIPSALSQSRKSPMRLILAVLMSAVDELAPTIIVSKVFLVYVARFFSLYKDHTTAHVVFYIELLEIAGMIFLLYRAYPAKINVQNALPNIAPLPNALSTEFILSLLPYHEPSNVNFYYNIEYVCYDVRDDVKHPKDNFARLHLDVHSRNDATDSSKRPVIFYIHGGSWTMGDKGPRAQPSLRALAAQGFVVVSLNYHMPPSYPFPEMLFNLKAGLKWIKANIQYFGGDPDWIAVMGDSAGGHLAALMALTKNDPEFQPGFEKLDTSFRAIVIVNAVTDIADELKTWPPTQNFKRWFARSISALPGIKDDAEVPEDGLTFLKKFSPYNLVNTSKASTTSRLPPILAFHGDYDNLVPFASIKGFINRYNQVQPSSATLIEFPFGHHAYHAMHGMRTTYLTIATARWLWDQWHAKQE